MKENFIDSSLTNDMWKNCLFWTIIYAVVLQLAKMWYDNNSYYHFFLWPSLLPIGLLRLTSPEKMIRWDHASDSNLTEKLYVADKSNGIKCFLIRKIVWTLTFYQEILQTRKSDLGRFVWMVNSTRYPDPSWSSIEV